MTVRSLIRLASAITFTIATLACTPTQSAAVPEPSPDAPSCPPQSGEMTDALPADKASGPRRFEIGNSEIVELASAETGRTYDLIVGLPPSFEKEPERRYPTLYLLDGQWDFTLVNTLTGGLRYDQVIPEFLIVGITYAGEDPDYGALRTQDYTPTKATPPNAEKAFGGDAPKFLEFLESSVINSNGATTKASYYVPESSKANAMRETSRKPTIEPSDSRLRTGPRSTRPSRRSNHGALAPWA